MKLPALRERKEDVPDLASLFLRRYTVKFHRAIAGITDGAMHTLKDYRWPGNVRELENLIERLVAVCDKEWITENDLPVEYQLARISASPEHRSDLLQTAFDTFARNFILRAVEGDVFALGRVYRNLIVNAIEATAPGGSIAVTTEDVSGNVRISVRDTETGIPPERLDAIFEDFKTTKRRGLGLGLAISGKIVEQLGGTITATS